MNSGNGSSSVNGSSSGVPVGEEMSDEELDIHFRKFCTKKTVPMVFHWDEGGKNAFVTGTFNNWSEKIPMYRSGNDFTLVYELEKGKYAYKFIVDDEWRFSSDQRTIADQNGFVNNYIDLRTFCTA